MSIRKQVADIRVDYTKGELDEAQVSSDPILQFEQWFQEAVNSEVMEPNAMSLGTVLNGRPAVRIVLLKGFDENGFVFYTNYESRKAKEVTGEPHAALTFFWPELQRQIRIEGHIKKVSPKESDDYYASRDRLSRLGAWASPQSSVLEDRSELETLVNEVNTRFEGQEEIPRPDHWGGYRVEPDYLEFWQGRSSRLHDRITYKKEAGNWKIERIAP